MERLPDHKLDLRDAIIPLTLLKISQEFREIKVGETMEILVNDPDTKRDLFKILPASSYEVMQLNDVGSFYRIGLIKKG